MASRRATFTIDDELAAAARRLDINISAAARRGVEAAVAGARVEGDRVAYLRAPERTDEFWDDAEAWGEP